MTRVFLVLIIFWLPNNSLFSSHFRVLSQAFMPCILDSNIVIRDTLINTKSIHSTDIKLNVHKPIYTMDKFIGTNAFIDVPQDKMKAVGFIREYHPWSFTEEVNDQFEYNKWNGFWDFDKYYKTLKDAKIDVCPAIWGSPTWLKPSDLNKPVVGIESPLVPNSYREM